MLEPFPPDAETGSISQSVSSLFLLVFPTSLLSRPALSSLLLPAESPLPSPFWFWSLVWNLPPRGFPSFPREAPTQRLLLRFPEPDPEATATCTHLTSDRWGMTNHQHHIAPVLVCHWKRASFLVLIPQLFGVIAFTTLVPHVIAADSLSFFLFQSLALPEPLGCERLPLVFVSVRGGNNEDLDDVGRRGPPILAHRRIGYGTKNK